MKSRRAFTLIELLVVIAISGKDSKEYWHGFTHPGKFEGVLPALWGDGGVTIYRVPLREFTLAHTVPEAAFPIQLNADDRKFFAYEAGVQIDMQGQRPAGGRYLNLSLPTRGNEAPDDSWIVGQVLNLNGRTYFNTVTRPASSTAGLPPLRRLALVFRRRRPTAS
jgi:prepilin-type N-terminal cleavage/methylation domain-containing protein